MAADELTIDDMRPKKKSEPCKVGKIIEILSETERQSVEKALAGSIKEFPHTKIAGALSQRIEYVSDSVVRKHRTKACSCER